MGTLSDLFRKHVGVARAGKIGLIEPGPAFLVGSDGKLNQNPTAYDDLQIDDLVLDNLTSAQVVTLLETASSADLTRLRALLGTTSGGGGGAVTQPSTGQRAFSVSISGTGTASVPASAAFHASGKLVLRAQINTPSYAAPADTGSIIHFFDDAGGYILFVNTQGKLAVFARTNGGSLAASSTVAIGAPPNNNLWVQAHINLTGGLDSDIAGQSVRFLTSSTDEGGFTPLGSDVTHGVTGLFNAPATVPLSIGSDVETRQAPANMHVLRAKVFLEAASPVLDIDFTAQTVGATSFAAVTGQTVTINAPGSIVQ